MPASPSPWPASRWQLDDQLLANSLLTLALANIADIKERQAMTLVAVEFLPRNRPVPPCR